MKSVSGKELALALERSGWRLHHVRGSHHYYVKNDEPAMLCIPIHGGKALKKGTQAALMKLAGLSDSDL